jgi:hypothetical protein
VGRFLASRHSTTVIAAFGQPSSAESGEGVSPHEVTSHGGYTAATEVTLIYGREFDGTDFFGHLAPLSSASSERSVPSSSRHGPSPQRPGLACALRMTRRGDMASCGILWACDRERRRPVQSVRL